MLISTNSCLIKFLSSLEQKIREELVECGWCDMMKELSKEELSRLGRIDKNTVAKLTAAILPHGQATAPEKIQNEVLSDVKKFIQSEGGIAALGE